MARILGIGNAVMDTVFTLTSYPQQDSEQRAQALAHTLGGNCANTLNILTQLGHDTALAATLAPDEAGSWLHAQLTRRRIGTEHLQRCKRGQTPQSSIWLAQDSASRTIVHFRDLEELAFDHFARIETETFDWLHFEGRNPDNLSGMLNICRTLAPGVPVSLEVEKARPGLQEVLPLAHTLLFSKAYALSQGHQSAEALLQAMRPQCAPQTRLFCTWGDQGAWALDEHNHLHHQPASVPERVIDTRGAGDTFNAGVIDALCRGHSTAESLALAVALAGKKVAQQGLDNLFANDHKTPLAHSKDVTPHKVRVVSSQQHGKALSVALIRHGEHIKGFINNCPHANVPLDSMYKIEVDPRALTLKCSVHDAYFRIEDGVCVSGPCQNQALKPVSILVDAQGWIYTA